MFLEEIQRVARVSKNLFREKKVKLLSQFDADGITSATILTKALMREEASFETHVLKQLTSDEIEKLRVTEDDVLLMSDFGSGQLEMLKPIIERTQVIILDHHEPAHYMHPNLFHVNPMLFKEDEMSASIVCYLFAKALNMKNVDLVDLALIGAVADEADEKWEFKEGLIKRIVEEGELIGKISVTRGLRLYGRNNRPLYRALAMTFDPFIPGISGSESNAVQLLSDLGIKVKDGHEWVTQSDLTPEENQRLSSDIIMRRMGHDGDASDVFGEIYTLFGRPEELQDVREMATIINACGRTGNHGIVMRLLLGDYSVMDRCWQVVDDYRRTIADGLNWVRNNPSKILKGRKATFILAKDRIPEYVIGTVTTIILNSGLVDSDRPVFGMAHTEDGRIKVSGRLSKALKDINLKHIISDAVEKVGGEGGGHSSAAGCLIPLDKEDEFVRIVGGSPEKKGEMIGSKES